MESSFFNFKVNIVFLLMTKQQIIHAIIWTKFQEHSTLTVLHVMLHSEIDTSGRRRAEQATANVSCSKTFF